MTQRHDLETCEAVFETTLVPIGYRTNGNKPAQEEGEGAYG